MRAGPAAGDHGDRRGRDVDQVVARGHAALAQRQGARAHGMGQAVAVGQRHGERRVDVAGEDQVGPGFTEPAGRPFAAMDVARDSVAPMLVMSPVITVRSGGSRSNSSSAAVTAAAFSPPKWTSEMWATRLKIALLRRREAGPGRERRWAESGFPPFAPGGQVPHQGWPEVAPRP